MTGFEIILNGRSISAAVGKGVLTVILTKRTMQDGNDISLSVAGLNLEAGSDTKWLKQDDIKEGDVITIKVKEIEQVTTPADIISLNKERIKSNRVQAFYDLKAELEKEGLI